MKLEEFYEKIHGKEVCARLVYPGGSLVQFDTVENILWYEDNPEDFEIYFKSGLMILARNNGIIKMDKYDDRILIEDECEGYELNCSDSENVKLEIFVDGIHEHWLKAS